MNAPEIAVIGAGPAGLAAALRLQERGARVTVFERDKDVGGASGSFDWNGHVLDYGPHAFHCKDSDVTRLAESFFTASPDDELRRGHHNVCVYLRRKFFHYPLQFWEVIRRINPLLTARMIADFAIASMLYRYIAIPDSTFEDWGIHRFGKTLYRLCFGQYTERVWKMPARQISYKFASQKVRGLSFLDLIRKLLGQSGQEQGETYWIEWMYPAGGSRDLYRRMAKRIRDQGGRIETDSRVTGMLHANRRISSLVVETPGQPPRTVPCESVLSTLPLRDLAAMLQPAVGDYVAYKARCLRYRPLILVCVELDVPQVKPLQWFYLLDEGFTFNRVTEQKNLSEATIARNGTVLLLELTCREDDAFWRMTDDELVDLALADLRRVRGIELGAVTASTVVRVPDAYGVYDLDFDRTLAGVLDGLSDFPNCVSTGRHGLFLQCDMHDSMRLGRAGADHLLEGDPSRRERLAWYARSIPFLDL